MYATLSKRGQTFAFVTGVIVLVIALVIVLGGLEDFNLLTKDDRPSSSIFNFGLWAAIVMTGIGAILFLVTVVVGLITNPKGSIKMIAAFGIVALLMAVFYFTATVETTGAVAEVTDKFGLSDGASKFVTAGLWTSISLIVLAVLAVIVTSVMNLFK